MASAISSSALACRMNSGSRTERSPQRVVPKKSDKFSAIFDYIEFQRVARSYQRDQLIQHEKSLRENLLSPLPWFTSPRSESQRTSPFSVPNGATLSGGLSKSKQRLRRQISFSHASDERMSNVYESSSLKSNDVRTEVQGQQIPTQEKKLRCRHYNQKSPTNMLSDRFRNFAQEDAQRERVLEDLRQQVQALQDKLGELESSAHTSEPKENVPSSCIVSKQRCRLFKPGEL